MRETEGEVGSESQGDGVTILICTVGHMGSSVYVGGGGRYLEEEQGIIVNTNNCNIKKENAFARFW